MPAMLTAGVAPCRSSHAHVRLVLAFVLTCLAALLSGCGYNSIQQKDEAVKAAWSEVLNVSTSAAPTWCPNLVTTVQRLRQP